MRVGYIVFWNERCKDSICIMLLGGSEAWSLRTERRESRGVAGSFYLFLELDLNHTGKLEDIDKIQTSYAKLCPCGVYVRSHAALLEEG